MVQHHLSTSAQRAQCIAQMIAAQGNYGAVTRLSQQTGVSRQTLYTWKKRGQLALEQLDQPVASTGPLARERLVLSLLVECHASYRGIQTCLRHLGQPLSLGGIHAIVHTAQQRALSWLLAHAPSSRRSIALDEIFAGQRDAAYLSIVDTHSWAVWLAAGPLAVDSESWTLLLWEAQDCGLRWYNAVTDGGAAMSKALAQVDPAGAHQRDIWHVLHQCAVVQARLQRVVTHLREQRATVARQAARLAAGQRPLGRQPQTDQALHEQRLAQAELTVRGLRYLSAELRELLGVVVLRGERVLGHAQRQSEYAAVLALLAELAAGAVDSQQPELLRLHKSLQGAQEGLLCFSTGLEAVQQQSEALLGGAGLGLVAWAWQWREALGYTREQLLASLPVEWHGAARLLVLAWEGVARASSAVENWHSILRPHLAVHRELSAGMLALLALWHNQRVFARGEHRGHSPLELSGMGELAGDWLATLGYAAASTAPVSSAALAAAPTLAPAA